MIELAAFEWLFWVSVLALAYTFVGYPILIGVLSRLFGQPVKKLAPQEAPPVSVVLVAYNEERRIAKRIENLQASDYPSNKLEIVVVTDGSKDRTPEIVSSIAKPNVVLLKREHQSGKSACVNVGVEEATGDIVVLCDARQWFAKRTISELVANFSDPKIGAVSGELFIEAGDSSVGTGVDIYWKVEKFVRESEARFSSVIGATGAVYAIRRELFEPIPSDTLLDDVVIPMAIAMRGYRIGFDPSAPAYDPQTTDPLVEKRRKQRTLAGNWQMLFRYAEWMAPWRTGLWWQVISHKYSRIVAPFLLYAMLVSNLVLRDGQFYRGVLHAQLGFYGLALLGTTLPGVKTKVFSMPSGFVFLNIAVLGGLRNYLRGAYSQGKWQ